MEQHYFTAPDTWSGGFYELAIEVGQRSDERLLTVLQALWSFPGLEGVFVRDDLEPGQQKQKAPLIEHVTAENRLFGIAHLLSQAKTACASILVREDEGSDWLDFCLPMGALSKQLDTGAFPFGKPGDDSSVWRVTLDSWLAGIGQFIFEQVQFDLALIGHEVSGSTSIEEVHTSGIPEKRWHGYLWSEQGKLRYLPCTEFSPPYSV